MGTPDFNRMHRFLLIGLISPLAALQPASVGQNAQHLPRPANVGRRALLLGVATALAASAQPANALNNNELESVMARASKNQLTTDGVIIRALNDDLLDVNEINGCKALEEIYKIDSRAAQEVRIANDVLLKLSAAERSNGGFRSTLPPRVKPQSIEEAYEIGRIIEQRISSRASSVNIKFALDCQADPATAYKEGLKRDSPGKSSDPFYKDSSRDYSSNLDFKEAPRKTDNSLKDGEYRNGGGTRGYYSP